jgi:glycosyltransferase involved in cell wall biosynthesis
VSIVIPSYNHGHYVAEAIDSVLAQDYPSLELIVIDDGSTDGTREVLAKYIDRVRVVFQENVGQAATINRGWTEATGEIVSYLSADDRLRRTAVSTAVNALNTHPDAVMVYCDYDLIDPGSATVRRVTAPAFDYTAMVRNLICAPGPGVFVRRSAAERTGGWNTELRHAPDFDYWLRLSLFGCFVRIPEVLAALRVHPGSASYAVTSPAKAEEPVRIMESYFNRSDLPASARAVRRESLASAHLLAARAHLRARRLQSAARSFRRATVLSPAVVLSLRTARLLANAVMNRAGHRLLWFFRRTSVPRKTT